MRKSKSSVNVAGADARGCSSVSRTTRCGIAVVAAALMLAPQAARGQVSTNVSITIPTVLYLSCTAGCTAPGMQFNTATDADYNTNGYVSSSSTLTLAHRGNMPYRITIHASAGTFGYAGTATDPAKPTSDLQLRATTGTAGAYVPVGVLGSPGVLYTRAAKGTTLTSTVDGRLLLNYNNDPAGTYTTTVTFTIVAP